MNWFFKILLGGFVICLTLVTIGIAGGGWWAYQQFNKPNSLSESIIITVPRGANIGGVADNLSYENIIDYPMIFSYAGRLTGQASKIKAGEYEIPPKISMKQILDLLESGKTIRRSVTIREGLTSYEIMKLLSNVEHLKQSDIETPDEGTLLPETYSYSKGESTADIIKRMQVAMDNAINELWESRADNLPIKTKQEAVILASIIEKETAHPDERERVAGVFINRLNIGMPLQTDPTVIYAITMGKHKDEGKGPLGRRLLRKDLKFDSPYNTYLYAGLPPSPIANAGYASIKAALNPEEHKYIYFVADGSGGHAFAKTLREHNNNAAKWRKIRDKK